ncbi:SDR family oxidoreductase [Hyalangium versicolor]|uniref:SDR family oxidoreductase n=1 Tax=Hyalangium versicolor TaxID=2861190 RepID=UPI001CCA7F1D|nr:SDR family oxidoreductase [Hyalangium versicolor]
MRYFHRMNLKNQHVIVIGGSSGIGLGVAKASLDAGASVTIVGRSPDKLAAAAAQLGGVQGLRTFAADITQEDQAHTLFREHPPANHVVLTAVYSHAQPIRQLELIHAHRTIDSKLVAALLIAKHARIELGGSLVFTTGVAADRPGPSGSIVAAVNGAVHSLVRALAIELAPIRVNALSPGWVDTPLWDTLAGSAKQQRLEQHGQRLLTRRTGTPADLGHAALFLMTNGFTTGEVLNVDGGHRLV